MRVIFAVSLLASVTATAAAAPALAPDTHAESLAHLLATKQTTRHALPGNFFRTLVSVTGSLFRHRTNARFGNMVVAQLPDELHAECGAYVGGLEAADTENLCLEAVADFLMTWKPYLVVQADMVAAFRPGVSLIFGAYTLAVHTASCLVQKPDHCDLWMEAVNRIEGDDVEFVAKLIDDLERRSALLSRLGSGNGANYVGVVTYLRETLTFEWSDLASLLEKIQLHDFVKVKLLVQQTGLPVPLVALLVALTIDERVMPPGVSSLVSQGESVLLLTAETKAFPRACLRETPRSGVRWTRDCLARVKEPLFELDSAMTSLSLSLVRGVNDDAVAVLLAKLHALWTSPTWVNKLIKDFHCQSQVFCPAGVAGLLYTLVHDFHVYRQALPEVCARTETQGQCTSALASVVAEFWTTEHEAANDDSRFLLRFAALDAARRTGKDAVAAVIALAFPKADSLQLTTDMIVGELSDSAAEVWTAVAGNHRKQVPSQSPTGFRQMMELLKDKPEIKLNDAYVDGRGAVKAILGYLKHRPEFLFIRPLTHEQDLRFFGKVAKILIREAFPGSFDLWLETNTAARLILGSGQLRLGERAVYQGFASVIIPRRMTIRNVQNAVLLGAGFGWTVGYVTGLNIPGVLRDSNGITEVGRTRESLSITRKFAFSDSMRFLGGLAKFNPRSTKIKFSSEAGFDAGGLTHEWLSVLTEQLILNSGIFVMEDGIARISDVIYYHPNLRLMEQTLVAVGELLGLAHRMNVPLGVEFELHVYNALLGMKITEVEVLAQVDAVLSRSLDLVLEHVDQRADIDPLKIEDSLPFGQFKEISVPMAGPSGLIFGASAADSDDDEDTSEETRKFRIYVEQRRLHRLSLLPREPRPLVALARGFQTAAGHRWRDIEDLEGLKSIITGQSEIELDVWQAKTEYEPDGRDDWISVQHFWTVMAELDNTHKKKLLRFWTGLNAISHESTFRLFVTSDNFPFLKANVCGNLLSLPFTEDLDEMRSIVHKSLGLALQFSMA
jgi:hypothetical protein